VGVDQPVGAHPGNGLCWFALALAYLAVLTAGLRRPVSLVDFSEAA